jgi:hypothetical protein
VGKKHRPNRHADQRQQPNDYDEQIRISERGYEHHSKTVCCWSLARELLKPIDEEATIFRGWHNSLSS